MFDSPPKTACLSQMTVAFLQEAVMRLEQLVKLFSPRISLFTKLPHPRKIASIVAVLLFFSTFSPAAQADQATLETLLADPTASISVGSLKFEHFSLDTFGLGQGPLPSDVTVSGITLNGESGLQFTGAYGPGFQVFDLMTFDVTTADTSALLHDATVAFDAPPILNPDDPGRASVESLIFRQPFFPLFDMVGHLLVCTEGPLNRGLCRGQNTFVDHSPFMELSAPGLVELSSAHVQVEISVN